MLGRISFKRSVCRTLGWIGAATVALVVAGSVTAASMGWVRVDNSALVGGGHVVYVRDVLSPSGGERWVAVGYLVDSDGAREPSVWSSSDALTWTRTSLPPSPAAERRDGVFVVARQDNVTVAAGTRFDNGLHPAVWRDSNGSWTAIQDTTDPIMKFDGSIEGLTGTPGGGFLAVGVSDTLPVPAVVIFTSTDGARWVRQGAIPDPTGEGHEAFDAVVANGTTVIVGNTASGSSTQGRIWVSKSGVWTQVDPVSSGLAGQGFTQVASVAYQPGVGFVAGGLVSQPGESVPQIWVSPDGVSWQALPPGAIPFPSGGAGIHNVVATGGGFLAAGSSGSGPTLWQSADARHWTAIDAPKKGNAGNQSVRVGTAGNVTVVVDAGENGSDVYRRDQNGDWLRVSRPPAFPEAQGVAAELVGVAATGSRMVAVGNDERGLALLMTSVDGRRWQRLPFTDKAARFTAVAANHGIFAIAGWRLVSGHARPAVWTSRTGTAWRRVGGTASVPIGAFADIAPDGDHFSAIALEGTVRGLATAVWSGGRGGWHSVAVLGPGEAREICVGHNGATAVAIRGQGPTEQVVTWHRPSRGPWSRDEELVANGSDATHCADGPAGTVLATTNNGDGSTAMWLRDPRQGTWHSATLANTAPQTVVYDVLWDGRVFLAVGTSGSRGQADLGIWRSTDGATWSSVGGAQSVFVEPGFQAGLAVARYRAALIVVGRNGAGNGGIWIGR